MSEQELDALVKDVKDLHQDKSIVLIGNNDARNLLAKHGMTFEELRKIQDKHYEVDVEFELTRDLYSK